MFMDRLILYCLYNESNRSQNTNSMHLYSSAALLSWSASFMSSMAVLALSGYSDVSLFSFLFWKEIILSSAERAVSYSFLCWHKFSDEIFWNLLMSWERMHFTSIILMLYHWGSTEVEICWGFKTTSCQMEHFYMNIFRAKLYKSCLGMDVLQWAPKINSILNHLSSWKNSIKF